jgi:hypothetical protein
MTNDLKARIAELEAKLADKQPCQMKVSVKGAVSLYGLGKYPVTLYRSQWEKLLKMVPEIEKFIAEHASELNSIKGGERE